MRGASKKNYPLNILIDKNSFVNIGQGQWEGRISIGDDDGPQVSMGVTLSNNEIRGGCLSDGIFLAGGASGIMIGPGNKISDIIQSGPGGATGPHCDGLQIYGSGQNNSIVGNYFANGSSYIQHADGSKNTLIKDNIFQGPGDGNEFKLRFSGSPNITMEHNTFINVVGIIFAGGASAKISNNIFNNIHIFTGNGGYGPCDSCTFNNNLFSEGATGSNSIVAVPQYEGGTKLQNWADFRLKATSKGYKSGSDGKDIGTNYFGGVLTTLPAVLAAPKNLRIVAN